MKVPLKFSTYHTRKDTNNNLTHCVGWRGAGTDKDCQKTRLKQNRSIREEEINHEGWKNLNY